MNFRRVLRNIVRTLVFIPVAVVILLCGMISVLYSPWSQRLITEGMNRRFSTGDGMRISMESFSLRPPLRVTVTGLELLQNADTMFAAERVSADLNIIPLLWGRVGISDTHIAAPRIAMGNADSLMCMRLRADSITLLPASLRPAGMHIDLSDGTISGLDMRLALRPDTTTGKPPSAPTDMLITLERLRLDRFAYNMSMPPTIDTLRAATPKAVLRHGRVDLLHQDISLHHFIADSLEARYIAPSSSGTAPTPAAVAPGDSASAPWVIRIDSIGISDSRALYAVAGVRPVPGLNFDYIEVESLKFDVDSFYNCASTVRLPMHVSGVERCGVSLDVDGTLDIDSVDLRFHDMTLSTAAGTEARFDGVLGMGDMVSDPSLPLALALRSAFAAADIAKMFPVAAPAMAAIPRENPISLNADVHGTTGNLLIDTLSLAMNGMVRLAASGTVQNMMNPQRIGGNIDINGNIGNVRALKRRLIPDSPGLEIPPMTMAGHLTMTGGTARGDISARTHGGRLGLHGTWNSRLDEYQASLKTSAFPINAFLPLSGAERITATLDADGTGYDPFSPDTRMHADLKVDSVVFNNVRYTNIDAVATLENGRADIEAVSRNYDLDMSLHASGNLDGDIYRWTARVDGRNIDLYELKFSQEPANMEFVLSADATVGPKLTDIEADMVLDDFYYRRLDGTIAFDDVHAHATANDSTISARILNRDMDARIDIASGLDSIGPRFTRAIDMALAQTKRYHLDADSISAALPRFNIAVDAGASNMLNDVLATQGMSFRKLRFRARNDSLIAMGMNIHTLATKSMRLDTVYAAVGQIKGTLKLTAGMRNRPGNLDQWHRVELRGQSTDSAFTMALTQNNLAGRTGFDIGMNLQTHPADSSITLKIKPLEPVIGYQQWQVNDDNYISYRFPDKHIDANLHMNGGNSSLAIFTEHQGHEHHAGGSQEDLVLQLGDIHVQDWIMLNPFAPPMKGDVSADIRLNRSGDAIVGRGTAGIRNFIYDRQPVAEFKTDFDVTATMANGLRAHADLFVDGEKTMTINGTLNDSTLTSPMSLDLAMIRFPLHTVNPFLPSGTARVRGVLNGSMTVVGSTEAPVVNGYINFDSTAVRVTMLGTELTFSDERIPVDSSRVAFDKFAIHACNDNPLLVDGTVDFSNLSQLQMDLDLNATGMQLVNSTRASRGADVYGKAFIDLDASIKGHAQFMAVDAGLKILPETNVTYVMPVATSEIVNRSTGDMVKFVNFADSGAVAAADTLAQSGMMLLLNASLDIEDGSIIRVDLSSDGKNRVQIESNGEFDFTMNPMSNGRLTGRLNINKGFARYSMPPVLSEVMFNFKPDSYIAFQGDMMNPVLNVHAVDVVKANVQQTGQNSRLVNFDVSLAVTGTLQRMNAAFDLSTNDDISVANELESMSAEQRANQAMNLLLYHVYSGPGTRADASMSNPLYSFLAGQLNTWAAQAIKGVDVSFGINQYDKTVNGSTRQTTSYSYQVSKSLFNERFKIVVGGNYSTDANADENFSQNLINDISFEYFLNNTRTMYIRLFRHTGYESILEGEVTATGVGFVYRKKLSKLKDMFIPARRRRQDEAQ